MKASTVAALAVGIVIGAGGASWVSPSPARAAGPAWEYTQRYDDLGVNIAGQLNKMTAEGWEHAGFYQDRKGAPVVVFRRPKP